MCTLRYCLLISLLFLNNDLFGCTGFFVGAQGQSVLAKSHDWGQGGVLMSNRRGVVKTAMNLEPSSERASWSSEYGSLTYTLLGKDLPVAGINEEGLTVEMFVLRGSQYPDSYNKPTLNEFQWVQYILDTSATLDEAILNSKNVIIDKVAASAHFMVCSASSECAVFEYTRGKQRIYTQRDGDFFIPVLSNSAYEPSISNLLQYEGFGGSAPIPIGHSSVDRFVKAATYTMGFGSASTRNIVDYAFDQLADLTWAETSWHFVFQPSRLLLWFRRPEARDYSMVNLREFDFSCEGHNLVLDIGQMDELQASNNWQFTEFSLSKNREILGSGLQYIDWQMTDAEFDHIASHSSNNACKPVH